MLYRIRTMSALHLKFMPIQFATLRHNLSIRKRWCTVTAVFAWSIEAEVGHLRLSHYCGTSHEKEVTVPSPLPESYTEALEPDSNEGLSFGEPPTPRFRTPWPRL